MHARPRLSVLAVTHYSPSPGGAARSGTLLWQSVAKRGHRVHVLASITLQGREDDRRMHDVPPEGLTVWRYEVPYYQLTPFDIEELQRYQEMEHETIRRALSDLIERVKPEVIACGHETLLGGVLDVAKGKG